MATLQYLTTTQFDHGALARVAKHLAKLGIGRPLVCTDPGLKAAGLLDRLLALLPEDGSVTVYDQTPGNPTETAVLAALERYREADCDGIVAMGDGSSMDLGKAVGLLATHAGPLGQYNAADGGSRKIKEIAPLIAIPTTAGTGSEVSVGAVIVLADGRKATLISPHLLPRLAICDPDLTLGLPAALTAATGMDAITHCIEAVLSPVVDPPAEAVGLDGLARGIRHIERAVADGADAEARWHMMMASTEGALAFIKGLGAVHGLSHALGRLPEPKLHHGTLNAVILPAVLRFNQGHAGDKYDRLRGAMNLAPDADLATAIEDLNARLGLPPGLAAMGVTEAVLADTIPQAVADLATATNPREAGAREYETIFRAAL